MSIFIKSMALLKLGIDLAKGDEEWHHPSEVRSKEDKRAASRRAHEEAVDSFYENWDSDITWEKAKAKAEEQVQLREFMSNHALRTKLHKQELEDHMAEIAKRLIKK